MVTHRTALKPLGRRLTFPSGVLNAFDGSYPGPDMGYYLMKRATGAGNIATYGLAVRDGQSRAETAYRLRQARAELRDAVRSRRADQS